jgi:hypothetical protein
MRRRVVQLLIIATAGGLLTTGCVYSHRAAVRQPPTVLRPTGEIIVREVPPEPRREVIGAAPDESHVWVPGYWAHTNNRWVWIPGHWEAAPKPGAVWVPGHWEKHPTERGWVWRPGRWE